jgi:uncharacterized protein
MENEITAAVDRIRKDKKVLAVLLFGSYARKQNYARDIDLCVMLDGSYSDFDMSRKRLDYLKYAKDKFDIQIFQLLPLNIRVKILKEGKLLYSKDEKRIYDVAYSTIKDYNLFEPHYKDYIEVAA